MSWTWLPTYAPDLLHGLAITLLILSTSVVLGFVLAVLLAVSHIRGHFISGNLARGFCFYIRGTPLLLQLYLLYFGIGSLFPLIPELRENAQWLVRLDAIYYVLLGFTLNFAGHEATVLAGGMRDVPRGEIEAAMVIGMSQLQVLRRVWLPSAVQRVWPILVNDVVAQLKATPIAFTLPVMDLMAVAHKVTQDTYLVYEPLLLVAACYYLLAQFISVACNSIMASEHRSLAGGYFK